MKCCWKAATSRGGEGIRDYARSIRSGANVQCLENDPTHLYHMKPQQSRFIYIFRWHIKLLCHETKSVARLGRFPHSVFFFKSSSNQSSYAYLICTLSEPLIFRLSGKDVFATDLNISRIFFFFCGSRSCWKTQTNGKRKKEMTHFRKAEESIAVDSSSAEWSAGERPRFIWGILDRSGREPTLCNIGESVRQLKSNRAPYGASSTHLLWF